MPPWCFIRRTSVYSSNAGVCPGSTQPVGLRMWVMLTPASPVLTRPIYSSTNLGLLPEAVIRVGCSINVGIVLPPDRPHRPQPSRERPTAPSACGHQLPQGGGVHWLGQVDVEAGLPRPLPVLLAPVAGDGD